VRVKVALAAKGQILGPCDILSGKAMKAGLIRLFQLAYAFSLRLGKLAFERSLTVALETGREQVAPNSCSYACKSLARLNSRKLVHGIGIASALWQNWALWQERAS